MRVLLLVSDQVNAQPIQDALALRGHQVERANAEAAPHDLSGRPFITADLIIADTELADRVSLVKELAAASPGIEFVLVGPSSGNALPADVIAQLDLPIDIDRLLGYVDEVADILDGERLREPTDLLAYETLFAGDSPLILSLLRRVRLVARSEASVWISGDDGSGRTIIARAIHDRSSRRTKPFIAVNIATYTDDELTRVLFEGDDAAVKRAESGTLFLEQISRAGENSQRRLLQFLEARRAQVGRDQTTARIIAGFQPEGTSRPFSSELFYDLKVLEIEIPCLKDRARDLEQIVGRMLERLATDRKRPTISSETIRLLERYSFPGNLLELAHALTHAFVISHGGAIEPQHLPSSIRQPVEPQRGDVELQSLDTVAKRFERDYLLRVLRSVGGNRGRTAEILGISRKGLWAKLKGHGITDDSIEDEPSEVSGEN
jgi:DNA-binding NtrC family response regulator